MIEIRSGSSMALQCSQRNKLKQSHVEASETSGNPVKLVIDETHAAPEVVM